MSKFKVGDVILTTPDTISEESDRFRNQLCIVRKVRDRNEGWTPEDFRYDEEHRFLITATTIATGEQVVLFEHEIVEVADG